MRATSRVIGNARQGAAESTALRTGVSASDISSRLTFSMGLVAAARANASGRSRESRPARGPRLHFCDRLPRADSARLARIPLSPGRAPLLLERGEGSARAASGRGRRRWRCGGSAVGRARAGQPRVASSAPPMGAADSPDLRDRSPGVPALRRTDAHHRVHHGAQGDREDPQAPRGQGRRRAQPARRAQRQRGLIAGSSAHPCAQCRAGSPEPGEALPGRPAGQGFAGLELFSPSNPRPEKSASSPMEL
jgi:hypothetical protein